MSALRILSVGGELLRWASMDNNGLPITDNESQGQNLSVPTQAIVGQVQTPQVPVTAPPVTPTTAVGQAVQSGMPLTQPQVQMPVTSAGLQKEQLVAPIAPEKTPLVELYEGEKIPEEVESWMEKLEQAGEIKIPEAIKKDEQIILDNAIPTKVQDTVVLPLTQSDAAVAAKKSVSDSARWLLVWCQRLVKMLGERARWSRDEKITV